jgi:3-hydroxyacyl-CoA dehydrogenase/enoyl-CoA hydratase/3-hydroxybutyryl-CoA epimerase
MSQTLDTKGTSQSETRVDSLRLEVLENGVAIVTFDVPGESMNTLQSGTSAELHRVVDEIEKDARIKAAVLISGKPESFVVGANIDMLKSVKMAKEAEEISRSAQAGMQRLASLSKPVVAAVHGPALGGGFELALACHARIATSDPKTAFGLPEVQLGLLPGADGLQRVAAIVGVADALDLGLTGKNMRAAKAKKMGLVDEVVGRPILRQAAIELSLSLAEGTKKKAKKGGFDAKGLSRLALEKNPLGRRVLFSKARAATHAKTGGHYPAAERILDVLEAFASKGLEASREVEAKAFGELVVSETAARLMEIFFATTALKKDNGTGDASVQALPVAKIAVLGAGLMGAGIAYVTSNAGVSVRLKDKDDASLARGLATVADLYGARVRRRAMTRIERDQKLALITGTTDLSGVGNADVVIEAVFEDLALKHRILSEVEAVTRPTAIFASNTSSIPITKIAAGSSRPERVVGMHYFSPVPKMPLLEIIKTAKTAPEVIATAVALGKRQGKTVIVVNDGVGFYTSRILGPYMNEAAYLVADGAPIDEIDRALVAWGWPVGPMALLDEVGIDVAAHVGTIMVEAFGSRMAPPPVVTKLTTDDRKGRKNERGLYLYGDRAKQARKGALSLGKKSGKKIVDTSVYELLGITPKPGKIAVEEIQMRCSLQFVNEALHCFGEGIVRSPRDGDIGAIFGLGFPPFRGGPFRYVDAIGASEILKRIRGYEDRHGARFTAAPVLVEMAKTGKRFYG